MLATPAEAKCHIYSVWHYPKPQRCFTALAPPMIPMPTKKIVNAETSRERIDPNQELALPLMDFPVCPEGDERLRGIAFLRALSEGQ